jgi:hypothetical protein
VSFCVVGACFALVMGVNAAGMNYCCWLPEEIIKPDLIQLKQSYKVRTMSLTRNSTS